MSQNPPFEYLEKELSKSIDTLKSKTKSNKRKTYICNAISIFAAAAITLCLGLDLKDGDAQLQKNIALVLAFILTVINSWIAVFDYKKLWMRQKSTLLDLYQLMNELRYRESIKDYESVVTLFDKYQTIWEKDSNEWRKILTSSASLHNNLTNNESDNTNGPN